MHDAHITTESTTMRLLLVANRTCPCPALPGQVLEQLGDAKAEVLVLAPALNSRLRHWVSDVDAAVEAAHERMRVTIDELRRRGLTVTGEVGDANPLRPEDDLVPRLWMTQSPARRNGTGRWMRCHDAVLSLLARTLSLTADRRRAVHVTVAPWPPASR